MSDGSSGVDSQLLYPLKKVDFLQYFSIKFFYQTFLLNKGKIV